MPSGKFENCANIIAKNSFAKSDIDALNKALEAFSFDGITEVDGDGYTLLHIACLQGTSIAIDCILSKLTIAQAMIMLTHQCRPLAERTKNMHMSPLAIAMRDRTPEIVISMLFKFGPHFAFDLLIRTTIGKHYALVWMLKEKKVALFKAIAAKFMKYNIGSEAFKKFCVEQQGKFHFYKSVTNIEGLSITIAFTEYLFYHLEKIKVSFFKQLFESDAPKIYESVIAVLTEEKLFSLLKGAKYEKSDYERPVMIDLVTQKEHHALQAIKSKLTDVHFEDLMGEKFIVSGGFFSTKPATTSAREQDRANVLPQLEKLVFVSSIEELNAAENMQLLETIFKKEDRKNPEVYQLLSAIAHSGKKEDLLNFRLESESLLHLVVGYDDETLFNAFIKNLKPTEIFELASTPNQTGEKPIVMASEKIKVLLSNACIENKSTFTNEQITTTPTCS